MVVKKENSSGLIINKNEGFCRDYCSVFCSVKFEASSPCTYVHVSILILPNLPLRSDKLLLSSRLLFNFYYSWPTVDPVRMIALDFFNMWHIPTFGMVILKVQVHAYSDICTPPTSISRKLEHCQLICCIGPLETCY